MPARAAAGPGLYLGLCGILPSAHKYTIGEKTMMSWRLPLCPRLVERLAFLVSMVTSLLFLPRRPRQSGLTSAISTYGRKGSSCADEGGELHARPFQQRFPLAIIFMGGGHSLVVCPKPRCTGLR